MREERCGGPVRLLCQYLGLETLTIVEPRKLYVIACHVLWREVCYFASMSDNVMNVHFLRQGLHSTPDLLRSELQQAIDEVDPEECDAILVGYGLCSNGIEGITARDTPLVAVRGHDCITFLLGSKERYREYFDANPGTYWYSPGWIDTGGMPGEERYQRVLASYAAKYGQDNADYLMEMEQGWFTRYSTGAYVDLGFYDTSELKSHTRECAKWLGWRYDELSGDERLMVDLMAGRWDDERFLVAEPGQTIVATHDERIIAACSSDAARNLQQQERPERETRASLA